jgi:tetratricopeptide (TPR) repeat protein
MGGSARKAPGVLVVFLLAMGLVPRTAGAQDDFQRYISAVEQLYKSGESERALEQLERARLRAWAVEQDVLVELYEGLILLDLDEREQALAAFETGLLLDPEARLPVKVSPKVSEDFERVRERVRKRLAQGAGPRQPAGSPAKPKLEPPPPPELKPFEPRPEVVEQARARVPVVPVVLAGVGVAAAGTGVAFGLRSRSSTAVVRDAYKGGLPPSTDTALLGSLLEDARGDARRANVMFGVAALSVGGAIVIWLLAPDDSAEE